MRFSGEMTDSLQTLMVCQQAQTALSHSGKFLLCISSIVGFAGIVYRNSELVRGCNKHLERYISRSARSARTKSVVTGSNWGRKLQ